MGSRANSGPYSSLGSASSAALQQYCFAAEHLGIELGPILSRLQLDGLMVNGAAERVSGELFQQLLVELNAVVDDRCFGLLSAQFVRPESYSILGYICMNAKNLKHALERAMPFEKLVGDMGRTELIGRGSAMTIRWHCQYDEPSILALMAENILASWVHFSRWLVTRDELAATEVHFRHPCPPGMSERYQQFFNCPVLFEQPHDQLLVAQALLEMPIKMPNIGLLELFSEQAQQQACRLRDNDYCYKVRQAIREGLGHNQSSKEDVAQRLFVSGRTLQRKLEQQDTSFRELYDQVRFAEARRLLLQPDINLDRLAFALDFADASSMQRWFRRVAGVSAGNFANTQLTQVKTSG